MIDDPRPVTRLNGLLAAARIAHEAIHDLHADLRASSRAGQRADGLVAESAGITLTEIPALTDEARRLARIWREQSVLDAAAAVSTLRELESEFDRIESELGQRLARQREIARQLQLLRDEPT